MDLGIAGRAALVCGASSGIGLAGARALAGDAIGRDFGVEARAVIADLTAEGACERAVAEASAAFGGLDILVANAGGPRRAYFAELSDTDWETAFRLTYMTTVRLIRAALPHMEKGGWGRVVTIGSLVTQEPHADLALSSGLRTGLVALTRTLAREHARHGVTVNLVSPGYTRTQRQIELANAGREETGRGAMQAFRALAAEIPAGRLAEPEEIGAVVAFLCSQPAGYVNGVNLLVDGGHVRGI
jgi:3-oxoacyl-[acyl-carrier protein] reductase